MTRATGQLIRERCCRSNLKGRRRYKLSSPPSRGCCSSAHAALTLTLRAALAQARDTWIKFVNDAVKQANNQNRAWWRSSKQ